MKKILFLFVFLLCTPVFAEGETETPFYPYMNTPETIYFDDNFDDREPGKAVTGNTDEYAITSFSNAEIMQEGDNLYCHTKAQWLRLRANKGAGADCDRLTIAFDLKYDVNDTYGNIYIGGEGATNRIIAITGGPAQLVINYYDGGGNAQKLASESVMSDGWNRIAITIRREADGDGYSVYPEKVVLNGKSHILSGLQPAAADVKWWENMYVNIGNFGKEDVSMDNVLIYSPEEFGAKTLEYDYETGLARAEFTAGILPEAADVVLMTADGEKSCTLAADEGARSVEIIFPEKLDLENNSYYVIIKSLSSVCGEALSGYKLPLMKSFTYPVREEYMQAVSDSGKVTVSALIEPLEGKTVYLAAGIWSGDKLLGFKIVPCSQPDIYTVSVETQETADRAQVFLLDSTENAGLVSKVYSLIIE